MWLRPNNIFPTGRIDKINVSSYIPGIFTGKKWYASITWIVYATFDRKFQQQPTLQQSNSIMSMWIKYLTNNSVEIVTRK